MKRNRHITIRTPSLHRIIILITFMLSHVVGVRYLPRKYDTIVLHKTKEKGTITILESLRISTFFAKLAIVQCSQTLDWISIENATKYLLVVLLLCVFEKHHHFFNWTLNGGTRLGY